MSHPVTWAKKTRPTRGDVCLTQRRGQKKARPTRGGRMSHPETWAKKQDLLGGDVCLTQRRGQKKARPTRGDVCLTQRCGQKKTRPMWGRRDSMCPPLWDKQHPVPSHWVGEEGLIDAPPTIKGDMGAHPCSPR